MLPLFHRLLAVLVFALAFAGCGADESIRYKDVFEALTMEQAKSIAVSAPVSCANEADCHGGVGLVMMILTAPRINTAMCTGFLVDSTHLLTNAHCIPDDLKAPGSACGDRLWVKFPKTNTDSEVQAGCSRIVYSTTVSPEITKPDYAIVELDRRVNRKKTSVVATGINDEETYQVYKSDPASDLSPVGIIKHVQCSNYQNSIALPSNNNAKNVVSLFDNCTIIPGNSGSPVLDKKGNAAGILFAIIHPKRLDEILSRPGVSNYLTEDASNQFSYVTNFSCTPEVYSNLASLGRKTYSAPSSCGKNLDATDESLSLDLFANAEADELARYSVPKNTEFKWNLGVVDESTDEYQKLGLSDYKKARTTFFSVPAPQCVQLGSSHFRARQNKLITQAPIYRTSMSVNRHLQRAVLIEPLFMKDFIVSYDGSTLKSTGKAPIDLTLGDSATRRFEIETCK